METLSEVTSCPLPGRSSADQSPSSPIRLLTTLFYLDPPYWGCENDYGKGSFARDDFEVLSRLLKGLKGRFILSINDVPEVRNLFGWAEIEAVETTYTVGKGKGKRVGELIVSSSY